jgi:hypothetical protein
MSTAVDKVEQVYTGSCQRDVQGSVQNVGSLIVAADLLSSDIRGLYEHVPARRDRPNVLFFALYEYI